LTCAISGSSGAAIYLDAPDNSLEDVFIQGGSGQDGIVIGYQAAAYNNVLLNVTGSNLQNLVHIKSTNAVSDITMMGITESGGGNSVYDELTKTTLTDPNLGMYILGEQLQGNIGYSRFTTSTNANSGDAGGLTWLVGSYAPSPLNSCATPGSLYSCTNGTHCTGDTLYQCTNTGWAGIR
jgi:hypothetical protein